MRRPRLFLTLAVIAVIFPVYAWISWTIVHQSLPKATQTEKQQRFLTHFPSFIDELNTVTLISLACLLFAMIFSAIAAKKGSGGVHKLSVIIFVISGILTVLTLLAATN